MAELIKQLVEFKITEVKQIQKIVFWTTLVFFITFSVYIIARN
jgi:hypothetical protein